MVKPLLIILLLIHKIYGQTDYCKPSLCSPGVPHVGCKTSTVLRKNCTDPQLVFMNQTHINEILRVHNEYRSRLASGSIKGFAPALRMPQLIWNVELAKLAQISLLTCQAGDRCRNTAKFKYVGQNAMMDGAVMYWMAMQFVKYGIHWSNFLNLWYEESLKAKQSDLDMNKARPASLPIITHFTNMINDKVTEVGCAALVYDFNYYTFNLLTVCNYNYANIVGKPVYSKGTKCSKCIKGCSKLVYPGLCNLGEVVV